MRSTIAAILVVAAGAATAAAPHDPQPTPEDKSSHALHGLLTMYAAGMVCYYNKWSFSKRDTDEMLLKIKELGKAVPKKTNDDMWAQAQQIMAEGQGMANQDRCTRVREQYAIARPFLFGAPSQETGKAPH